MNDNSNLENSGRRLSPSGPQDETSTIKFLDWGFKIDRLFEVAFRFYKRNESKAFFPTFDERNQMNALILQARYGNFDGARAPDIGTLDLVGRSRRHQWSLLKGMSKAEAMSKFICTLDEICPIFKAYAEAVKISSNITSAFESDRMSKDGSLSSSLSPKQDDETDEQLKAIHTSLCRQTYDQFKNYAEKQFPNDPKQQKYLISSLQEQYYQQYISQLNPRPKPTGNNIKSEIKPTEGDDLKNHVSVPPPLETSVATELIPPPPARPIVGQKFNTPDHTVLDLGDFSLPTSKNNTPLSSNSNEAHTNSMPHHSPVATFQQKGVSADSPDTKTTSSPVSRFSSQPEFEPYGPPQERLIDLKPNNDRIEMKDASPSQSSYTKPPTSTSQPQEETQLTENQNGNFVITNPVKNSDHIKDTWSCSGSSGGQSSPLQRSLTEYALEPASLWTKRGVHEFREALMDDKHGGSHVVNQGTLVTIQVPTYPDGRYIHFEFCTEDYDIGFGLDFVFEQNLIGPLSLQIREESDDDNDEDDLFGELEDTDQVAMDLAAAHLTGGPGSNLAPFNRKEALARRRAEKLERQANTIAIVPTYRRDSHEEIFVGRHRYPGCGYYLLKFDNTYSVLRSKSLFYRICYFI